MSTEKVEINEAVAQKSTEEQVKELKEQGIDAVSYTHLTLPTIYSV